MRSQDLDSLAEAYPDCLIAAFADISVGIALRTAAGTDVPREALDELCAEAGLTLGQTENPDLGQVPAMMAVKAVEGAIFVYMRTPEDPGDALICMCRDTIALDAFLGDARAALGGEA